MVKIYELIKIEFMPAPQMLVHVSLVLWVTPRHNFTDRADPP